LNPDISQTAINLMPVSLAGVVAIKMTVAAIQNTYQSTSTDSMRVEAFMLVSDEYGRNITHPLFSFKFTRTIFNKINWAKFKVSNLQKVAPFFKYSDWYFSKMQSEIQ
jgi:hypothetical protein